MAGNLAYLKIKQIIIILLTLRYTTTLHYTTLHIIIMHTEYHVSLECTTNNHLSFVIITMISIIISFNTIMIIILYNLIIMDWVAMN